MAKLHFKYASMNSGKSIDLIRTVYNYEENGFKVLVMKPGIDTKGEDYVETRIGLKRKVDFLIDKDDDLFEKLKNELDGISVIFIDEAQFLDSEQVDDLFIISKVFDVPIICYGLRTNFKMEAFEGSRRLLEIADDITELKTICKCGKKATQNLRTINGIAIFEGDQIAIDGESEIQYTSVCGECYLKVRRQNGR